MSATFVHRGLFHDALDGQAHELGLGIAGRPLRKQGGNLGLGLAVVLSSWVEPPSFVVKRSVSRRSKRAQPLPHSQQVKGATSEAYR